jgi:1,2-diacylglycerol 3-alpha-glucosyltransferase
MPALFAVCDVYVTASLSEMNSISMLEGMASGLPTLQRYDELNKSQITEGVNGWLYHDEKKFAEHLLRIAGMSAKEKQAMKNIVCQSVIDRGPGDLARYMLDIYSAAIKEKTAQN